MEQMRISREEFWGYGGEIKAIIEHYGAEKNVIEAEFSFLDEFLTLICC